MATTKETAKQGPFSVVMTGGKQYVVRVGDVITIEKLVDKDGKEYEEGNTVTLPNVLLTDDGTKTVVGTPEIKGASITCEVVDAGMGKKTTVIHYRSKSRHFKKYGHRQPFLKLKVTKIA